MSRMVFHMIYFYTNNKEVNYLLDGILDVQMEIARKAVEYEIDAVWTGDDFGNQLALAFSPAIFRKYFKARYEKLWGFYRSKDKKIFHHSCGNTMEILDDLIEIGLDVINPVQPEAMNIKILSDKYSDKISFFGGISTQRVLPFGTREEVINEIREKVKALGINSGYIVSPSHEVTSDCPMANFEAMRTEFMKISGVGSKNKHE